jgi:hypothetical protein
MGVAEVSLLRIYNICVQQPASQAILRRSAWSIPMFRADFLHFTSKLVPISPYLLAAFLPSPPVSLLVKFAKMGGIDGYSDFCISRRFLLTLRIRYH